MKVQGGVGGGASSALAAPTAPGAGGRHGLTKATAGHHATFGELVPTKVSCGGGEELGSGWDWGMENHCPLLHPVIGNVPREGAQDPPRMWPWRRTCA